MSERVGSVTLISWLVLAAVSADAASIEPKLYSVSILRLSVGYDKDNKQQITTQTSQES